MRDLIPIRHLALELGNKLGIDKLDTTEICKTTVHKDNQGCLKLAQLEPGRMTPRSKFYAIKYHWFRSHLKPEAIVMKFIKSEEQKADFLTKALGPTTFEGNRKLTMGW